MKYTFPLIPVNAEPAAQEVFDAAVEYLLNQEERCVELTYADEQFCVYRNSVGNACAVGAFLPDDSPLLSFLGSVPLMLDTYPDDAPAWFHEHVGLLQRLQVTHDNYAPTDCVDILKSIAGRFNLKYNGPS